MDIIIQFLLLAGGIAYIELRGKPLLAKINLAIVNAEATQKEVKDTLKVNTAVAAAEMQSILRDGRATLQLCNGEMLGQKEQTAIVSRSKAEVTHDPADIIAAEVAWKVYSDHKKLLESIRESDKAYMDALSRIAELSNRIAAFTQDATDIAMASAAAILAKPIP